MILVDANLLLYAKVEDYPQHDRARDWLDRALGGVGRVALPWPSLLAFVRIGTHPRLFARPMTSQAAWKQVTEWLSVDNAWIPVPTERHAGILGRLVESPGTVGNLVSDAHLAALALEYGLTLCTTDADFARFAGLRWENPL